ncbi:hypothetical protein [Pseudomonas syringae]|uniref:hypothetical protein n=1 Tax=Pseudomonas syringae TaxID=317 RepID=UPI0011C3DDFC|nr:hypothetical protein [Pseudomonas syringae]
MNSQANASRPARTHHRQHPMKNFDKYAERMKLNDVNSVSRRQMWPAMVKRIQAVFDEIEKSPLASHFGSFFLHPVVPDAYRHLPEGRYLAQLQLTCGIRRLGLDTLEKSEEYPQGVAKILLEKDAAMWFNQSPSGAVTVFMAPYRSAVLKMNEENIILGLYSSPDKLTDKRIRELFSTFFRYLSITSAHHQQSVMDYGWRLWLIYKDARTKKHEGFVKTIERLLMAAGAAACIWVIFPSTASSGANTSIAQAQHSPAEVTLHTSRVSARPGGLCTGTWLELARPWKENAPPCSEATPARIPYR